MNLNTIRIDNGQPLTEEELDARIAQRTGPQPITTDEADAIIRASWPLTAHRHNGCDYSAHTSECCEDWRHSDDAHRPQAWGKTLGLAVAAVALLAVLVLALGMLGLQ